MMKLYIGNKNYSSWSLRPWVLMRQLEIEFEENLRPFPSAVEPHPFREFSPTGKVPCLVDGATTVWDSLAICEYLAEQFPRVWPSDSAARAWARSAAAEMHSGYSNIRNTCTMNCGLRVQLRTVPPAVTAEWARMDELWCDGLSRFHGPFLAGQVFTAVDAFYAPVAFRIQTYSPALSEAALGYAQRLLALPTMQQWYEAALREPWREEQHEAEAREVGVWLQDLRHSA